MKETNSKYTNLLQSYGHFTILSEFFYVTFLEKKAKKNLMFESLKSSQILYSTDFQ